MQPQHADLAVQGMHSSLRNKIIDLVVTGSVASIESFRLIRSLRRLGATVRVYLSPAGSMFITPAALEWASGNKVITEFHPSSSHLASAHMCVVAPASASFIGRLKSGITDHAAAALCQSYLGANTPVMLVPCMHDFLGHSPIIKDNLQELSHNFTILDTRQEDQKQKFPDPTHLAYDISHHYHRHIRKHPPIKTLLLMGATRSYLDDVRYLSSRSSGQVGSAIGNDLYLHGIQTFTVSADAMFLPEASTALYRVTTATQMLKQAQDILTQHQTTHLIMPASISDFAPQSKHSGKYRSSSSWNVNLLQQSKLRSHLHLKTEYTQKICFKLEPKPLSSEKITQIAQNMHAQDGITALVVNVLHHAASQDDYQAIMVILNKDGKIEQWIDCTSRLQLAAAIRSHIITKTNNI